MTAKESKITTIPRFLVEVGERDSYAANVQLPISGARISVGSEAVLSEYDIVDVKIAEVEYGRCLQFVLTRSASRDFYKTTTMNQGRRLVLLINGQAMGVRIIDRPIGDGVIFMFLEVSDDSLEELVKELKGSIVEIRKRLD